MHVEVLLKQVGQMRRARYVAGIQLEGGTEKRMRALYVDLYGLSAACSLAQALE
jgi:hypothetical protein